MIAISFDIDWAPDAVIADTLELLDAAGVQATLFATHATSLLAGISNHEIGLHPNFLPTKDYGTVLDRLLELYPQAQGVRCHSYYQNSHILDLFVERGLIYDSNVVMLCCNQIKPFRHWNNLIRLPVFWEDDVNAIVNGHWDPYQLGLSNSKSLYIFDFHPIHVYLNTETLDRYQAAKPYYHDPIKLQEFVNPESSGVGTRVFLRRLLALVSQRDSVFTLGQIAASLV